MKHTLLHFTTAWVFFAITFAFAIGSLPAELYGAQSDSEIELKWNQGDEFDVSLEQETIVDSKVEKRARQVINLTILEFAWTVESVNESGDATIKQAIKRLRMKTGPPGVTSETTIDLDSAIADQRLRGLSKTLRKQIEPLIDQEFTATISNRGEILSVAISDELTEKLRDLPASMQVRQLFTKTGLQDLFGVSTFTLPEKKLSRGDKWTVEKSINGPTGSLTRKSEYEFTGMEGPKAVFSMTASVDKPIGTTTPAAKPPVALKLNLFSGSGEFTLLPEEGYLSESEVTSQLETQAPYQSMQMTTKVTTTTKLKTNKK